jgi:type I restriction enzyme R subunit
VPNITANTYTLVERLLSTDYADKVIVTTIQKLGLALDGANKNNYKEQLKPLASQRIVFIFDECHRSQFGENNKAIQEFFPNAQLFGFTGTPIFEQNATSQQRDGGVKFFLCSGGVMFFNDCLDNGLLDYWLIFSGVVCCV